MNLERGLPSDAAVCLALRDDAARRLTALGIEQWAVGEVALGQVAAALSRGEVWVVREDGRVVATVTVTSADELVWGPGQDPARYVHRLVTAPGHPGLGAAVLAEVERRAGAQGAGAVRLDCVESNARLRRWYAERGYAEVGRVAVAGWHPAVLLEKELDTRLEHAQPALSPRAASSR